MRAERVRQRQKVAKSNPCVDFLDRRTKTKIPATSTIAGTILPLSPCGFLLCSPTGNRTQIYGLGNRRSIH